MAMSRNFVAQVRCCQPERSGGSVHYKSTA